MCVQKSRRLPMTMIVWKMFVRRFEISMIDIIKGAYIFVVFVFVVFCCCFLLLFFVVVWFDRCKVADEDSKASYLDSRSSGADFVTLGSIVSSKALKV